MIVLLSAEESAPVMSGYEVSLAKARAQIRALQADNLRMRDEVAESERSLNELRKQYNYLRKSYIDLLFGR